MLPNLKNLRAWIELSRPPFQIVGVLPFLLGAELAWFFTGTFRWDIFAWGTFGVVLVMLATYYAGEFWDFIGDSLSRDYHNNPFAGGTKVLQQGLVSRNASLWASLGCVVVALCVGIILQFGYHTGIWTIPLGIVGLTGGFFYSTQPVRWVARGVGELWIAFCYGWLPIAVSFYLQTGYLVPLITVMAIPVGLTCFNLIMINEFPDYPADIQVEKANIVVRLGRERAARLYGFTSGASWIVVLASVYFGVPLQGLLLYAFVFGLSLTLNIAMMRGRWQDPGTLEKLCAGTYLVNLGTTAAYLLAFIRVII